MKEFDVVIVGGGLGGCAAALSIASSERDAPKKKRVAVVEEYSIIGGQITSQAVPLDIHKDGEANCTASFGRLLSGIRDYYKQNYPVTEEARNNEKLSPGNGWVSTLCSEPRVNHAVLRSMLAPYESTGQITVFTKHKPERVEREGNKITSVIVRNEEEDREVAFKGKYFLDATECGDLLELGGIAHVTGSESKAQTQEPHALDEANPNDVQGITYCFAVDYREGEDHTIEKPEMYDFWRNFTPQMKDTPWPGKLLSWTTPQPWTLKPETKTLFPQEGEDPIMSLWLFRRIIDKKNFKEGTYDSDITLVNWPQNDYWLGNIYGGSKEEKEEHLENAKQLSLSLLYWMQTEAPRPDGGHGYPGLRLRKDIVGTEDGLAMAPYIRESRRLDAEFTLLEQHVSKDALGDKGAVLFDDMVGRVWYNIDLHPSVGGRNYIDIPAYSAPLPLGAFIPKEKVDNVLPAAKNIGATHLSNGVIRVHTGEWNIGEVSGLLASHAMDTNATPREIRNTKEKLRTFQDLLVKQGVKLSWEKHDETIQPKIPAQILHISRQ